MQNCAAVVDVAVVPPGREEMDMKFKIHFSINFKFIKGGVKFPDTHTRASIGKQMTLSWRTRSRDTFWTTASCDRLQMINANIGPQRRPTQLRRLIMHIYCGAQNMSNTSRPPCDLNHYPNHGYLALAHHCQLNNKYK